MSAFVQLPADLVGLPEEAFAGTALHAHPVVLGDGKPRTLWFREVNAVEFRRFQLAEASDDDDVRAASVARLIACSLCNPDGTAALTTERAATLKPAVMAQLLAAVMQVNGLQRRAPEQSGNASPPGVTTGSGTSSPSHSEAAPSTSGSA